MSEYTNLEFPRRGYDVPAGAGEDRGEIVRRFNREKECRVFLGSLKAGGAGTDLAGGPAVLHYDRWWNAAREDQATYRVQRIGQHRAVQVFKLVTEGWRKRSPPSSKKSADS